MGGCETWWSRSSTSMQEKISGIWGPLIPNPNKSRGRWRWENWESNLGVFCQHLLSHTFRRLDKTTTRQQLDDVPALSDPPSQLCEPYDLCQQPKPLECFFFSPTTMHPDIFIDHLWPAQPTKSPAFHCLILSLTILSVSRQWRWPLWDGLTSTHLANMKSLVQALRSAGLAQIKLSTSATNPAQTSSPL